MSSRFPAPSSCAKIRGKAVVCIIGSLLTLLLLSQTALAYEQEVKQLSGQMAEAITKSGRTTVAVVDFTDLQGNVTELGRFLAEEFSVALAMAAKDFQVIDRTNLKTLLQEHKLASTGIIDPQTARKLGEIAGVQALVTGSITPFGDSVRLSVKVLDASTARVVGGFTGDIPRTKAIDELLAKGITGIASAPGSPSGSATPTSSANRDASNKPTAPIQVGDFSVSLRGCQRRSDQVECAGSIVNRGDKRQWVSINRFLSYLVDNTGVQTKDTKILFGPQGDVQTLETDIPVNFRLDVSGASENASTVSLIMDLSYGNPGYTASGSLHAVLRNIPLQVK